MKCQQYETKAKVITRRVNEHKCLRHVELWRKRVVEGPKKREDKEKESTLKKREVQHISPAESVKIIDKYLSSSELRNHLVPSLE